MTEQKEKKLVYWTEEKTWSIVSTIVGDDKPGSEVSAKFQGKAYPALLLASKCMTFSIFLVTLKSLLFVEG